MSTKMPIAADFLQETFSYDDEQYTVVLVEEMAPGVDEDNPDFTGCWVGILISNALGTVPFLLTDVEEDGNWQMQVLKSEIGVDFYLQGNQQALFPGIVEKLKEMMQKRVTG